MDIIAISDTHGRHRKINIEPCELLIHIGDVCNFGNTAEIKDFMEWFSEQPATYKFFVAGNHDTCFEMEYDALINLIPKDIHFIENSIVVISYFEGSLPKEICIASVPARMGNEIGAWIDLDKVDILLAHCPPYGILDDGYGSKKLKEYIDRYKPQYALFGHNHLNEPKEIKIDGVTYVNVSEKY